jgi:dUTP pyrophosphatase
MNPILKVKKLHPDAILPRYQTAGAACFDLHCVDDGVVGADSHMHFGTGLSFEVPVDHVMLVFSRSGHGFKNRVRLANGTGVIDSDYRGTVAVMLFNDSEFPFTVNHGDRIAQAMILPVQQFQIVGVDELGATERGAGGFGSTGQ